jgi:transposase
VRKSHIKKEIYYKERDESEREAFVDELTKISDETDVIYVDECGVQKEMNPIRGRAKRGVKIYQKTSGKRIKKDNVIAGYCNGLMLALCIFAWATNTEWFCEWFEYSLIPLLKPNSVIVMDNATFHSKVYLPIIAEAYGHKILWLPKYSPDKNPIEHAWANLKNWLRNYSKNYANIRCAILDHFQW